jgi:hypothetical protein
VTPSALIASRVERAVWRPVIRAGATLALIAAGLTLASCGGGSASAASPPSAGEWAASVDRSAYQEVQLRTGPVLYGRLRAHGALVALSDVFYRAAATKKAPQGRLVKRGGEPEGSTSPLMINPDDIALVFDIGAKSSIARTIAALNKHK